METPTPTRSLNVRLTPETHDRLALVAYGKGVSKADVCRMALLEYLGRHDAPTPNRWV